MEGWISVHFCSELTFKQHLETKSTHHKEQAEIKDVQAEMGNMQLLENNPFQGGHISLLHR